MKIKLMFLLFLIFILACSSQLPAEPVPLSEGNKISGNAVYDYTDLGWGPPVDIFNDNSRILFVEPNPVELKEGNVSIEVNVEQLPDTVNSGLVYKYGYYLDKDKKFHRFEFLGETLNGSNWIQNQEQVQAWLELNDIGVGENFIVAYSCQQISNQWKCGCIDENRCGNWMLQDYVVLNKSITLPSEPTNLTNIKFSNKEINITEFLQDRWIGPGEGDWLSKEELLNLISNKTLITNDEAQSLSNYLKHWNPSLNETRKNNKDFDPDWRSRHSDYSELVSIWTEKLRQISQSNNPKSLDKKEATENILDLLFTYCPGYYNLGHKYTTTSVKFLSLNDFDFSEVNIKAVLDSAYNPHDNFRKVSGIDFTGAINFDPHQLEGLSTYRIKINGTSLYTDEEVASYLEEN